MRMRLNVWRRLSVWKDFMFERFDAGDENLGCRTLDSTVGSIRDHSD